MLENATSQWVFFLGAMMELWLQQRYMHMLVRSKTVRVYGCEALHASTNLGLQHFFHQANVATSNPLNCKTMWPNKKHFVLEHEKRNPAQLKKELN